MHPKSIVRNEIAREAVPEGESVVVAVSYSMLFGDSEGVHFGLEFYYESSEGGNCGTDNAQI